MRTISILFTLVLHTVSTAQWIRDEALPDTETPSVLVHGEGFFVGGINAVYHKYEAGAPWETWQELPGDPVYLDALAYFNGSLYAGTGGNHMFRSPNGLTPWQATPGLVGLGSSTVTCIAEFNGELYSGTAGAGTFKFNGTNWQHFGNLGQYTALNVNMLRSIGDTLWCGAGGNGYLFYLTPGVATWTQVSVDVVTSPSIDVSDILSVADGYIVGTSEGLYHSTNGGISWTIIPGFGTGMLKFARWNNAIIATRTTVVTRWYYSEDEGQTWTQFSMTPLCFGHTVFDGRLYSGQLDGLWYMENGITSIHEPAEQLFTIFPNPASHELNIQLNEGGSANYTLLDMQGRTVMSGSTTGLRTQLSLSVLVAGTYLLRVEQDGSIANERFVVQ